MAGNDGYRIPMGSGGLLRYYDESKSKFQIKPQHVVIMIAITVLLELILKFAK